MPTLWFRAKRYGYGWYPASREGWLVLIWYAIFLMAPLSMLTAFHKDALGNGTVAIAYIPYVLFLTGILVWICVKKGEKARWRWGSYRPDK